MFSSELHDSICAGSNSLTGRNQPSFDIVVASDNNNYLAWQCMVFHHSCVNHLGRVPIIVVHGGNEPLVEGYRILKERGGNIQRLPTQQFAGKIDYVCRNVWSTLKGVKTSADNIVLCDTDLFFLRPVDFSEIAAGLNEEAVSLERVGYMQVGDHNRSILEALCRASWIDPRLLSGITISGGMPYVIPTACGRIGREWAAGTEDCLTASHKHYGKMNSEVWISIMWGFVFAALRNDIPMHFTDICALTGRLPETGLQFSTNGRLSTIVMAMTILIKSSTWLRWLRGIRFGNPSSRRNDRWRSHQGHPRSSPLLQPCLRQVRSCHETA